MNPVAPLAPPIAPRWPLVVALAAALVLGGCGPSKPSYPTATLEGTVRIGGHPVAEGVIRFLPAGTGQAPPVQARIADGRYRAEDVPLGPVRVTFSACRDTGRTVQDYSSALPEFENLVPEKYRDGVPLEVTGDRTGEDFDL